MSQISPYSLPDLKSTTDDALPNYLTSLKFVEDHTYTDVRLALGYVAVAIAGTLFYADWKLGWDATKPYTLAAVVVYFALNSAFTYWIWFVEKGAVFSGRKDGVKVTIASATPKKYDPTYTLTIRSQLSPTSPEVEDIISASVTRWFTSDGFFTPKPFQQWLASSIEAIGRADPSNVVEEIGRGSELEQYTVGGSAAAGDGTGKGGKAQTTNLGSISDVLQFVESQGSTGAQPTPGGKKAKRRG